MRWVVDVVVLLTTPRLEVVVRRPRREQPRNPIRLRRSRGRLHETGLVSCAGCRPEVVCRSSPTPGSRALPARDGPSSAAFRRRLSWSSCGELLAPPGVSPPCENALWYRTSSPRRPARSHSVLD